MTDVTATPPAADPATTAPPAAAPAAAPAVAPSPAGAADPFGDPALVGEIVPPVDGDATPPADGDAKPPADGEGDAPVGAPEEYAAFDMPEGVELNADLLGEFTTVAKELNLPQDAAQKVVAIAAKLPAMFEQAQAEQVTNIQAEWATQAKADPEIGGANLVGALADAKRGLAALDVPAFGEVLSAFGLNKHPDVIRAFAKLGKLVAEDKFVGGGDPAGEKPTTAQKLYPTKK